jgi:hypothetical protein
MIRTVPIPKTVSRMGCASGSGCCDECGGHAKTNLGSLHDTACDQDGNCYDTSTGTLLSAPLTTGPGCAPGVPSCAASGAISATTVYLIGGLALFAFLFASKGK